jgi:hypothetical protein
MSRFRCTRYSKNFQAAQEEIQNVFPPMNRKGIYPPLGLQRGPMLTRKSWSLCEKEPGVSVALEPSILTVDMKPTAELLRAVFRVPPRRLITEPSHEPAVAAPPDTPAMPLTTVPYPLPDVLVGSGGAIGSATRSTFQYPRKCRSAR